MPEESGEREDPETRPDRRSQILDAAHAQLSEGGFAAVSVRAVAARAGIGASTMRYYFPSQEQLTAAVAQRSLAMELRDERIADASLPAVDRLTECLAQFLPPSDERVGELHGWFALVSAAVGPASTPLGKAMYEGMLTTTRDRLDAWLAVLASEGAIEDQDRPRAASALLTRIDGLALGLLLPGAVPNIAAARAILREEVRHLLVDATAAGRPEEQEAP